MLMLWVDFPAQIYVTYVYMYLARKHFQCERLLGLAGGTPQSNTTKRGNKKCSLSITPIRYNVIHMYIFTEN